MAAYQLSVPVNASKAQLGKVAPAAAVKAIESDPKDKATAVVPVVAKNPAEDPKPDTEVEAAVAVAYKVNSAFRTFNAVRAADVETLVEGVAPNYACQKTADIPLRIGGKVVDV